jgi:hypothetical protein
MNLQQRIAAFARLGDYIRTLPAENFRELAEKAALENPWFTPDNVQRALRGLLQYLDFDKLSQWTDNYRFDKLTPQTIAIIMAGNIPLVGFHDLLCVLISGHRALIKYSSKDSALLKHVVNKLIEIETAFSSRIILTNETLNRFDAIIATGSDNSARYFHQYFAKYPHIIRKNRVSVAVLDGNETNHELELLGEDVFSFFGLGCRNVAKIFVPAHFDTNRLAQPWKKFESVIYHHKYANNYDYQKSILLVNRQPFTDFGFVLLKESDALASPVSVIYIGRYNSLDEVNRNMQQNRHKIQCIMGKTIANGISFGQAQYPELWDYADGIDTLKFLESISR